MADEIAGRHICYERMHALLAVAGIAKLTNPTTFELDAPPSGAEQQFGTVLGQAFHQGCQLADVAIAAGLPPEQVVAIGKRTIRRTNRLKHLKPAPPTSAASNRPPPSDRHYSMAINRHLSMALDSEG